MAETVRIRLVVLGDPVPMPRARVVKGHAYTPEEATEAKKRIAAAARLTRVPFFVGPVTLGVDVYLPTTGITFWKRGSGDWDNYAKLAADALEGIAYANDAGVVDGRGRKFPATDGRPRLEITLEGTPGERPEPKPRPLHPKRNPTRLVLTPAVYRKGTK